LLETGQGTGLDEVIMGQHHWEAHMPAYLIANITVTDPKRYPEYRDKVAPVIAQYGGKFLIRGGAVHSVEGDLGVDRLVVIEFADMETARQFYDSPEYAPLLKLRLETTRSQVAFAQGYAAS
jgi:uncharacterized protein (DUF1330 family)